MRRIPKQFSLAILAIILSGALSGPAAGVGANEDGARGRGVILIHDSYELQNMSKDLGGSYELANDINAWDTWEWNNYTGFLPVGDWNTPFTGTLDGKGFNISLLRILQVDRENVGLFGETGAGSKISNLTMTNYNITGKNFVGGLAGRSHGMIENCGCFYSQTPIASEYGPFNCLGGLVGWNDGELRDCFARDCGRMFGSVCGGLIGLNAGIVRDCTVNGNISGIDIIGGVAGNNTGLISGCLNTGNVTGGFEVGGIVGQVGGGTIINCTNNGAITGFTAGGIAGGLVGNISDCTNTGSVQGGNCNGTGGIATINWMGSISGCANSGSVSGTGYTGGIVGANFGNITRSYNIGTVTGTEPVGGVAGRNDNQCGMGVMADCYNTGAVSGTREVGGLVGALACHDINDGGSLVSWGGNISRSYNAGAVSAVSKGGPLIGTNDLGPTYDCFWDTQTSGYPSSVCGTGKSTAEMKKQATFVNWDFINVWKIIEDTTYPYLRATVIVTKPFADAGPDLMVDEDTPMMFNGSASSGNGGIVNYTWNFTDGVSIKFYGAKPSYIFKNPGVYNVTLNVTDAAGNWNLDAVVVTVKDITRPLAEAGPDQVVDQDTMMMFNGSGSSDNIGIVNYTWTFMDVARVALYGVNPAYKFDNPGIFVIMLNVTDAAGNWGTKAITITVKDIIPPMANAGKDQIVPAGSIVLLNASRSSDNVGIVKYAWSFIFDGKMNGLEGRTVLFTFDKGGIFEIVLTVTDMAGNFGNGTVIITVVDTGTVTGTVLDEYRKPVEGASVEIASSYGITYAMKTAPDGKFSVEVYHGSFTWNISKSGYHKISGNSSVDAMNETQLDLSNHPLKKEEKKGSSNISLIPIILMVVVIVALSAGGYLFMKRKRVDSKKHE